MIVTCSFLASCTTSQRLTAAASTKGRIEAGVMLPELVADCRIEEPHAALAAGSELRSVLIRERSALDRANGRVTRCAGFYDDLKTKFKAG